MGVFDVLCVLDADIPRALFWVHACGDVRRVRNSLGLLREGQRTGPGSFLADRILVMVDGISERSCLEDLGVIWMSKLCSRIRHAGRVDGKCRRGLRRSIR